MKIDVFQTAPEGASVPALGLSNKAVFTDTSQSDNSQEKSQVPVNENPQYQDIYFSPLNLSSKLTSVVYWYMGSGGIFLFN